MDKVQEPSNSECYTPEVVGLERGPLSLMSVTELNSKVAAPGLENRD
jgi:uncharacterized small protein (DUF1192 family)